MLSFFPIGNCLFSIEHFSAGDFRSACLMLANFLLLEVWECRRRVLKGLSTVFEKMARPYERWRAVHLMNQIVGSGSSLIPSNDYK